MTRLLHIADSHIGRRPFRSDERAADIVACFDRAIEAAIEHRVDVLLHAGMLLDHGEQPDRHAATINEALGRLRSDDRLAGHEVTVVLLDPADELWELNARTVRPGSPVELDGLTISCDAEPTTEGASVLVRHGRVGSLRGGETREHIDPVELLQARSSYIALGGLPRMQAVQPNAFYSGATARLDAYDTYRPGGLLVDIGRHTGALRSITRLGWYDRPHISVAIEARGLDAQQLCMVLRDRLHEAIGNARSARRDASHAGDAPVLHVKVLNPQADWRDVCTPGEMWLLQLDVDGPLYTSLHWGDDRKLLHGSRVVS